MYERQEKKHVMNKHTTSIQGHNTLKHCKTFIRHCKKHVKDHLRLEKSPVQILWIVNCNWDLKTYSLKSFNKIQEGYYFQKVISKDIILIWLILFQLLNHHLLASSTMHPEHCTKPASANIPEYEYIHFMLHTAHHVFIILFLIRHFTLQTIGLSLSQDLHGKMYIHINNKLVPG